MDPFIGEIRIFAGNFPPTGWALCNGQVLPIAQNTALFSLLGTQYGGDGRANFALPDLQARMPLHQGAGPGLTPRTVGETGGVASVTLTAAQMHVHSHGLMAGLAATSGAPELSSLAPVASGAAIYRSGGNRVAMNAATVGPSGAGLPHNNLQPYLALNFIIALQGVYPPRT
jgi:microcystin-dependent protein